MLFRSRTEFAEIVLVIMQDSMLDLGADAAVMSASPLGTSSAWPVTPSPLPAQNQPVDATSRAISFVLGFALASVFAWIGSIPMTETVREVTVTPTAAPVAPAVEPVVTTATVVAPSTPTAGATAASELGGSLVLSSNPEGAQVLVNGRVAGKTPVVLEDVPVGPRALLLRQTGYAPWSASVRIIANQQTAVHATLAPSTAQ